MPRKFEDSEIGETLGVGTAGTIYRVTYRPSRQACAPKLLSPAVGSDPQVVRRFEREMRILAKLHHPNILAFLG